MKKTIGAILAIGGLVALIIFGIQAMNDSESFNLLGSEVVVSSANWTPVIISGVVFIVGLLIYKK